MSGSTRVLLIVGGVVLLIVAAMVVMWFLDNNDGLGLIQSSEAASWTYFATGSLVFADAIVPIFPGETALNASATLAASGSLQIGPVILAGTLGAVIGDNVLYWISRRCSELVEGQVQKLRDNPKVSQALAFTGGNAPVMIVSGRYIPGVRFFINATMGIQKYPYRKFLLWSTVGGLIWASYTSLLAYWIGSVLDEIPLASIIISGAVTSIAVAVIFFVMRRNRKVQQREAKAAAELKLESAPQAAEL